MINMYRQIAVVMFRAGIFGYGGGPSIIPLIRHEAVTRYKWLSDDEFGEVLALANTLPGPIATKLAAYLGYRQKQWLGASLAVLAHILPSCIAMLGLLTVIQLFSSSAIIQGMIAAVVPIVAVMFATMAYQFGQKTVKGLGLVFGIACFAICFVLLEVIRLHPALIVLGFILYGAFHYPIIRLMNKIRSRKE